MRELTEKVAAVYDILSDVYDKSPWTKEQILSDMQQDNVDYFFVEVDKTAIGFLAIQQLVGELEITNIAVKKAHQGEGWGSQLLAHLDHVDFPIFLEVRASNTSAQALYQKFGFEVIGKRQRYYHEPVEDAIIMKREGSER
ncbi:ribosomal protein S18-alanine N-acetyltransferase [Streptococcus alactolyticus]|jgi:ribosomal-protein-alanine N-acetyltransferase|uniref:[Ribosomal protein bS18]-alanine N-acetyltransferase n=2 Tax=Streptococcus TaxID=1301 RepID=A0A6N7WQ82_STRAY|nr:MULTISPECIES: ribosomal protein S18-alanine N-acetyltransferase [Streptococcus]MDE2587355.1 ribosomal protein S18-alanine N-acetyltransferase [Lactobacillales bacterium]HIZ67912.1 ribosomal protein S18-alanine N-acetyltransferase [Candidatus Streptococcus faecavium]MCF2666564.1 ribosomal protein S18-alanine N-acetyltransferase [Streptococcus alactolyticus]MCF2678698.1 ribosomal protein S18-alanine N-acetyltransferase [Streptococcus alactolyticus]MCI6905119.1 ribosomal protein S18-alanine N-